MGSLPSPSRFFLWLFSLSFYPPNHTVWTCPRRVNWCSLCEAHDSAIWLKHISRSGEAFRPSKVTAHTTEGDSATSMCCRRSPVSRPNSPAMLCGRRYSAYATPPPPPHSAAAAAAAEAAVASPVTTPRSPSESTTAYDGSSPLRHSTSPAASVCFLKLTARSCSDAFGTSGASILSRPKTPAPGGCWGGATDTSSASSTHVKAPLMSSLQCMLRASDSLTAWVTRRRRSAGRAANTTVTWRRLATVTRSAKACTAVQSEPFSLTRWSTRKRSSGCDSITPSACSSTRTELPKKSDDELSRSTHTQRSCSWSSRRRSCSGRTMTLRRPPPGEEKSMGSSEDEAKMKAAQASRRPMPSPCMKPNASIDATTTTTCAYSTGVMVTSESTNTSFSSSDPRWMSTTPASGRGRSSSATRPPTAKTKMTAATTSCPTLPLPPHL
eukprot:Rhum_TRINITY_DN13384_c0_g2::Rhum_TRINITY_DN13384_c0_g2_i2::g.59634::m.59634